MKKISLLLVFTIVLVTDSIYGKAYDGVAAGEYLESISKEFKNISQDMWDYTSSVAHGKSARKVENRRKEVLQTLKDAEKRISKISDFEGDKSFRDSVISYLKLSYTVLNYDYGKIVDMEEIAEQSYDAMEAYLTAQQLADEKLDKASEMVSQQQKIFAANNHVNLIENKDKVNQKLEKAGEVFYYYNKAYLIFFKSYKQEAYLIDAQNKGDVNALKQNMNTLGKFAEEGLQKTDTLKPFQGDATLKASCSQMLSFYKQESEKFPVIINYYMEKEKFEKTKTAFDSSKKTKEDADRYNQAVNDFNKSSQDYNKLNQELNNKRAPLLNNWNKSVDSFLNAHVPKKR